MTPEMLEHNLYSNTAVLGSYMYQIILILPHILMHVSENRLKIHICSGMHILNSEF